MMMRLEYENGKAAEVEADDKDTLRELMNEALYVLWGSSARQVGKLTYRGVQLTTDEMDEFLHWKDGKRR